MARKFGNFAETKIKFIKLNNGIFNFSVRNEGSVLSCTVYEACFRITTTTTTTAAAKGKLQDSGEKASVYVCFVIK